MTDYEIPAEKSCIRRAPQTDRLLAEAVRRLHETGPRLVVELEAEIERLQKQLARLQNTVANQRSAELVGMLKG
jgi:hypothetical protein